MAGIVALAVSVSSTHPQTALAQPSAASEDGGASLKIKVTVQASDSYGRPLSYRWRATDGRIDDVNAPTTSWTVADGPGVHFAYVLVSNGAGGYDERRLLLNTDTIGTPLRSHQPLTYLAPAAPVPVGEVYRSFVGGESYLPNTNSYANIPDVRFFAQDASNPATRFPKSGSVKSNIRGEFAISRLLPVVATDEVVLNCEVDPLGSFGACGSILPDSTATFDVTPGQANTDYLDRVYLYSADLPNSLLTAGSAVLQDGTPCGTVNEFFGVTSTGTASLLDGSNQVIGGPARLSDLGAYALDYNPAAVQVMLQCEGAAAQFVAVNFAGDVGTATFANTGRPTITDMTATLHGTALAFPVGFMAPLAAGPSDVVPNPERFLSYKGIDSRQDACAYYKAIGAAQGCDEHGSLVNPISFDDWQRATRMGKYATPGPAEFTANYINKADLNLARNHHSISYGPNQTAAYVCNHLGPTVADPLQPEIDSVIDTLVNNQKLVACVAMDYTATPGVNGGQPFVRFLIFGPNGQLLPSVNLDGRREKFVPGTCIVCHGGDHYASHFLAHPGADVGAHYLPYDSGNFEFSDKPGLTECDQSDAIYNLNQNVLNVNPTVAEQQLIPGWYQNAAAVTALGCGVPPAHAIDKAYLPASWQNKGQAASDFYQFVVARSCRGCHVAMVEGYNWDHYENIYNSNFSGYRQGTAADLTYTIGCQGSNSVFRSHSMPNSLVTFNRFWNTVGSNSATDPDQLLLSIAFLGQDRPGQVALHCTP